MSAPLFSLILLVLAAPPATNVASVSAPPAGTRDADLTRVYSERAVAESREALAALERDTSRSSAEKSEIKKRLGKLKVTVYTTPKTVDECVAFYEKAAPGVQFIFAERNLAADLEEAVRTGAIQANPASARQAAGRMGKSARWRREDGALEVDIEEYILDPRDGSITKKTVVLVTSLVD